MNLFKWFKKIKPLDKPNIVVTEGIGGTWHYHLSYDNKTSRSLCGEQVMPTNCSLNDWGYIGHLKEKYCEKCKDINNVRNMDEAREY
jgi:hypothetical protein